jgi:hypothetical protein
MALKALLPDGRIITIADAHGRPDHVVFSLPGFFFDADGVCASDAFLTRWSAKENITHRLLLQPFEPTAASVRGIPCSQNDSIAIAAALSQFAKTTARKRPPIESASPRNPARPHFPAVSAIRAQSVS